MLIFPSNNLNEFNKFAESNCVSVDKYIMRQIRKGFLSNKKKIKIFKLGTTQNYYGIEDDNYEQCLRDILQHFINHQEYELADECKSVIGLITDAQLERHLNIKFVKEEAAQNDTRQD